MAKTLHFTLSQDKLHPAMGALVRDFNGTGKPRSYKLSVANALWGQSGHPFRPEFLALNQANYDSGLNLVDFAGATEKARLTINDWCERKTENKIKNAVPEGSIDATTRWVLTNAIYFKGTWNDQFDKQLTQVGDFHTTASTVRVPLMHRHGRYRYLSSDGIQALELPYKGKELSMFVFLPTKADGLADMDRSFASTQAENWIGKLAQVKEQKVDVRLPRFTITDPIALKPALIAMGHDQRIRKGSRPGRYFQRRRNICQGCPPQGLCGGK